MTASRDESPAHRSVVSATAADEFEMKYQDGRKNWNLYSLVYNNNYGIIITKSMSIASYIL